MLQSVHTVRWLLHALALLLAVCAVANPASWNVIHVPARAAVADSSAIRSSSASIGNRSALALPDAARVPQAAAYVTFAPGHYCVVREHTRECHEYAHLLKSIGSDASSSSRHRSAKDRAQVAIHAATEQDIAQVYTDATDRVVMSWCRIQSEGSWFVQGAQSMGCLVVLETCLYTMVFWVLFSGLAALFALTSSLWPVAFTKLEPATAFCSYLAALLGVFLVVEWWGYSTYFIDKPYLQSQALVWHYGTAFKLVCVSVLLSLVAARITLHLAIRVRANYAQLHSTPPELSPTSSTAVNDSPIAVQRDECDDTNVDPLQCPPNYQV